MVNLARFRRSK